MIVCLNHNLCNEIKTKSLHQQERLNQDLRFRGQFPSLYIDRYKIYIDRQIHETPSVLLMSLVPLIKECNRDACTCIKKVCPMDAPPPPPELDQYSLFSPVSQCCIHILMNEAKQQDFCLTLNSHNLGFLHTEQVIAPHSIIQS